jgi:hypothetical protein
MLNDPSNPWSWNAFEPGKPHAPREYKSPYSLAPKDPTRAPAEDLLFRAQDNALKAMNSLQALEGSLEAKVVGSPEWQRLSRNVTNTYRVIRSWLAENAQQGTSGGGTFG